jgi:hypothetical protein
MRRKMHVIFFIAAFAAVMIFSGPLSSEAGADQLLDIGEASWAEQEITEMSALEILEGYPDGRFLPYQSVTRLEAVAMLIRMLGLDDQARAMEEADVAYQVPYLPWGRGYLIMGVERGMLDKNYLNQLEPTGAATRAQVAALVCLAFDLNATGSSLDFADAAQIPYGYQEYVAALVEHELMQGLPGNVFEPNSVINRAQMAVLLSNLLNKELANPYPDRRITGKISNIEPSAGLITLQGGISRILTAECRYYLDGEKAGAAELKAGDEVKLVLNKSNQVVFVKAERTGETSSESGAAQIYTGKVSNLLSVSGEYWLSITDFNGDSLTRSVTGGIKVDKGGRQQDVSLLSRGDYVEIRVVNNKITKISTLDTSAVKGTVTSKRSTALTVRKDTGATIKLNVPAEIVVTRGEDNVVSYDALREGYLVDIEAYENEAIKINIIGYGNLEGVIREVDASGTYGITIRNDDGDTRDYIVASDVEVRKEGYKIGFDELRAGERVKLELNSEDRVDYISVLDSDSGLEGWIRELDTSGAYGITIYDDDGAGYDYVVDSDVEVWEDDSEIDFDELRTGARVILELNSQDRVVYINVLDSGSGGIEGVIRELDTSGAYSITIRDDDDQTRQYAVNSNVEVRRDGSEIDFDELRTGERVMLEKNSRGRIDYIVVIKNTSSNITGKIADLVTGNKPVIRIEKSNGNRVQYTITNSTAFYSDGESIRIYDLVIGSEVEVKAEGGKAKSIDVTDDQNITLEGEVTDVNTSSNKIKIKQVSGNEFTYYLKSNASLKDRDGDSINFKDVSEGWEVKLKLQDGKVYSLTKE